MGPEELAILQSLPDTVKVWRGIRHRKSFNGLSWTLDRDKAVWFANRLRNGRQKSLLIEGEVNKKDVLAYFAGRDESEIVSMDVRIVREKDVTPRSPAR
jgi:hypothetical protein